MGRAGGAPDQLPDPQRAALAGLGLGALQRRALAEGVPGKQLEAALGLGRTVTLHHRPSAS